MANKYHRLFCLNLGFNGRSFHPSPPKKRSNIIHTIGVLMKINAPRDFKFEGSPSNLSTPTPIHPQVIATKLNRATFRSVLILGLILLTFRHLLRAYRFTCWVPHSKSQAHPSQAKGYSISLKSSLRHRQACPRLPTKQYRVPTSKP